MTLFRSVDFESIDKFAINNHQLDCFNTLLKIDNNLLSICNYYRPRTKHQKWQAWQSLERILQTRQDHSIIIGGDFNEKTSSDI